MSNRERNAKQERSGGYLNMANGWVLVLLAWLLVLSISPDAGAQASTTMTVLDMATGGVSSADLVDAILGADSGCVVSNITVTGSTTAAGTFANGGGLGFSTGMVLSSGAVEDLENDISFLADTQYGGAGDADLDTLTGASTEDAFVLEFDFVPTGDMIFFKYRFGSEEDFADIYDDAFGLFVNGVNVALLPDGSRVSVLNIGSGPYYVSNSANALNNCLDGGFSIELDATTAVNVGVTNTMKIAIADAGDQQYDGACFIGGGTFQSNNAPTVANAIPDQVASVSVAYSYAFPSNTFNDVNGDTLSYTATLSNDSALPAWLSLDSGTRTFSGTPAGGDAGVINVKVTADDSKGGTVTDTFQLTVSANAIPVITQGAGPLTPSMSEDSSPTAWSAPTLGATDGDGDTLTWSVSSVASNGTADVSGTGASPPTFTYAPDVNWSGSDSFTVQVSDGNGGTDTIDVDVTVSAVGDTPQAADITTDEDTQSGAIVLDRNSNDGGEVTNFKITSITNGSLYKNDGTTAISDGDFITYAEGQAGLKFTPSADSNTAGSFTVESSEDGSTVAAQSGTATSTITVTPVGDTPQVADITTDEDTQSGAIVIDRNANDGAEVTDFKITSITNGSLYKNDGTTAVSDGDFITYAEGQAGLKFTPDAETNTAGSFTVESSEDGSTVAAQSGTATSTITVTPVGDTPQVADITTDEDTQSGAIVIDRNANDGAEVTNFKITAITNGSLYKNDGTTPVSDGNFITYAEGQAGLKFTPGAESNSAGSFTVESSEDGSTVAAQSGTATSTITVTPVGDTPQVADITTDEDTQSGAIVIDRNANDGVEVTNFKITSIANGSLYKNDGTTAVSDGDFITYAEGQAGLKFTPSVGSNTSGNFTVESSEDGSTAAAQSATATSTITVTPVGDTPQVADITTDEDTQSGAIVIDRNANDGVEVTDFKITSITNGSLYKDDGTTAVSDGDFITYAEGQAGLKFTPDAETNTAGSFTVESSEGGSTVAAQSGTATSTITVTPVGDTPQAADITTDEDTQSGAIVIDRNANDGGEVTNFKITSITNGLLYKNDGTTAVSDGDFITYAEGQAGLKFTPGVESNAAGSFTVESSEDGSTVAAQSGTATSTITVTPVGDTPQVAAQTGTATSTVTVTPVGDTPQVADITTDEDTQSGAIVIDRNANDGTEVTHFKITAILNGSLFQSDGTTAINDGDYLTYAQGLAGVKFSPSANSTAAGSFAVESSEDGVSVAAQSGAATSTITVEPVNDAPTVGTNAGATVDEGGTVTIDNTMLDGGDVDDSGAGLTYTVTTAPANGQLELTTTPGKAVASFTQNDVDNTLLVYVHDGGETTSDSFDFSLADGGEDGSMPATDTFSITVTPVNDPPVLNVIGPKEVDEDALLEFAVSATDPEGDTLVFNAADLPTGASFDPATQTFSWTPGYDVAGVYPNVLFSVTDDGTPPQSDNETISITVGDVNRPPVLDAIGAREVDEGTLLEFAVTGSDPDGDALLYDSGNLPTGASFDPDSALSSVGCQSGVSPLQNDVATSVTEGNCVAARRGGEQPEVNDQSVG